MENGFFLFESEIPSVMLSFSSDSVEKIWTQDEISCNARVIQFYEEGEDEQKIRSFNHS